ncbi:MAG: hypothetical protein HY700_07370 [Gemmatimonadetes bacterium]|nr:hypothetical protein [Gemmatimonadota bacterium]
MNGFELPADVRQLIRDSVPTPDALEALVLLVRNPAQSRTAEEMVVAMLPIVVSESAMNDYLALFRSHGLVVEQEGARFAHQPATPGVEAAVRGLLKAYNERPVTLIRTVYAIADSKRIQSFADAFKLKKDE